jgi:GNAT superfamily N-acetyltransferase
VLEVQPGTAHFEQVLILAARVLAQDRYLASRLPHALESHVLAAFDGTRCAGFLRYLVQVIGAEEGRPPVLHDGEPLLEGYVEAFGVDPQRRRRGIGTALQQHAARQCRTAGCYQMRSRSPVTSAENYALKLAAGYVLHPAAKTIPTTSSCAFNRLRKISGSAATGHFRCRPGTSAARARRGQSPSTRRSPRSTSSMRDAGA